MAQVEPMDVDNVGSEFDDKENSLLNSNVLPRTPCTEKGYEELDVSELNMKLRYSITPASSPMSRSYTASCKDNKTYIINEDSLNSTIVNNNTNLTRSLNSSITKCDISKSPKLPLQSLPTDQYLDKNSTARTSLDNSPNNITITINGTDNIDENFSLPSTSSSTVQTPEATTPTKDIPKDGGSPIMRGLKSVLSMFRSSQSPIPPEENVDKKDPVESYLEEEHQIPAQTVLASTPKDNHTNKDNNSSKRSSPLKDSVTFNDDLERELQWKDETTIIFKQEKIPIHKLFLQQSTSLALEKKIALKDDLTQNLNTTIEYMDISCNESVIGDKTMTDIESNINAINVDTASGVESDGEFLDCETTETRIVQIDADQLNSTIPVNLEINDSTHVVCSENSDSQTGEQKATEPDKDTEALPINVSNVETNVEFEKPSDVPTALINDQSVNELVNVSNEHISDVTVEFQKDNCLKDDIHIDKDMNVTRVLDVSTNENESNNFNNQSIILEHKSINNDETETSDFNKENILTNILNCPINEEIIISKDEKQLTFDVTSPLNIDTDHDNILVNDNPSNNFVLVEKEDVQLNENNIQAFNSGILQICDNILGDTVHEHANNTLNIQESNTYNLEQNKTDNDIENYQIIKSCSENSFLSKNDESNKTNNYIDKDIRQVEAECVELSNLNNNSDIFYLNNKEDFKEEYISTSNQNNNEIQNNSKQIIENTILQYTNSQNTENNAPLHDLPLSNLTSQFPSDIPLPSDDDMEKDSLMDNLVIKHDDLEELDVKTLHCIINDNTIDSLETMEVFSQEADTIKSEQSINLNNILPLSNADKIQNSTELNYDLLANIPEILRESSPIRKCELINETEILQESAPTDLPDNNTTLPYIISETNQHQCSNNIETMNDNDTGPIVVHVNSQSINNDVQIVEDIKIEEQNCNMKEEYKNDISSDVIEFKENKLNDEEIVTSANNSPYVSVNDLDLNIPENDIKLDEIESPFETKSRIAVSPPISPKLSRGGYNINFDEIEDPFATKTNIRTSPPPESSPKSTSLSINISQKKADSQKRVQQQNRRKSQPERQKRDLTKKRFNNSYSCDTRRSDIVNTNDEKKLADENNKIVLNCLVTTPEVEADNVDPTDTNKCEVDKINNSSENLYSLDETIAVKEETKSFNNEPTENNSSEQNIAINNTSEKKFSPRNVFNLPEIDDINFNPFQSKSKILTSQSPTFEKESILLKETSPPLDFNIEITQQPIVNLASNIEVNTQVGKIESSNLSNETSSSRNTDFTVREIATEDEDTAEGPFLEAEEFSDVVKVPDFSTERDMMQFEDLHANINNENKDEGELFIDAEAFEFLLNQNKSNVVADSGKESLFLKFDPLFAKRVSSDGVLAALNRIQRRQSTPKKAPEISNRNNVINEEVPSVSSMNVDNVLEESNDETNITITKPMMVVNPAINSLVSPRKSITPPRINRRSLTFTSPAMAVIDRLLSLSGNSSTLDHDTSLPRTNREYNDTDVALTQLRELLAEKEINVHNLRCESKELKVRLDTMESQMKILEKESEKRLKKVNDLNEHLTEKTKINKSMALVVEEYERTIASLITEMEQEKKRNAEEKAKLISERDEQTAHLASMEVSFSDLHSKYEKSKQIILSMKSNEDTYKRSMKEFEDNLLKMQNNYELLKQHATSKLNHANQEMEKFNRAHESEVLKLNAMIKRKELHITSLEESLAQKTKTNEVLATICDELINKVG